MYAKVFAQIHDSSLADDYLTRLVFMDLLILADRRGVVDLTISAVARRTNVPVEIVTESIVKLSTPDPDSRTPIEDGRRLVLLSDKRGWGWQIVNYEQYREIQNTDAKREYHRKYMQNKRAERVDVVKDSVKNVKNVLRPVKKCKGEVDVEVKAELKEKEKETPFSPVDSDCDNETATDEKPALTAYSIACDIRHRLLCPNTLVKIKDQITALIRRGYTLAAVDRHVKTIGMTRAGLSYWEILKELRDKEPQAQGRERVPVDPKELAAYYEQKRQERVKA